MMSFPNYLKNVIFSNRGLGKISFSDHRQIYSEWKKQIESKKYPIDLDLPWITIIAKNYLERYLGNKKRSDMKIFEFGSGGSSLFFLKYADQVVTVEHDKEWFEIVTKTVVSRGIKGWTGVLLEAELTPENTLRDISDPLHYFSDDSKFSSHQFKNYASYIENYPDQHFDAVLVDGRSRPACVYHSVKKIKKGGLLVLDNAERKYYLSRNIIKPAEFSLVCSSYGALICYHQFTQTNIYIKL